MTKTQVSSEEGKKLLDPRNQNPDSKIDDVKRSEFVKSNGRKTDHETLNKKGRDDIIEQNSNQLPRDDI